MIALAGCEPRPDRVPTYPVEGTVRFNGKPTEGATIVFTSVAAPGKQPVIAEATVDRDGRYALSTYVSRDGAPAGEFLVTLAWPEANARPPREEDTPTDRLRGRYATPKVTPLRATVREQPNTIDFKLP